MLDKQFIVCDIDGTLANIMHRVHLVQGKSRNYDMFHQLINQDKPEFETIAMVNALHEAGHTIIFASGRPEETRGATEEWLQTHVGEWTSETHMFMRKDGDKRSDVEVKTEMLTKFQAIYGMKPTIAIDDRLGVCQLWHENGIRLFRMGNPDLDNQFKKRK